MRATIAAFAALLAAGLFLWLDAPARAQAKRWETITDIGDQKIHSRADRPSSGRGSSGISSGSSSSSRSSSSNASSRRSSSPMRVQGGPGGDIPYQQARADYLNKLRELDEIRAAYRNTKPPPEPPTFWSRLGNVLLDVPVALFLAGSGLLVGLLVGRSRRKR